MIFIDLENNPPPLKWIKKADLITRSLLAEKDPKKRNDIIDKNEMLWSELKEYLSLLNNEKCWYTESKNPAAHCHVDHFRPKKEALDENNDDKGGYWWLAFDWMNYRYSGPAPNTRKKSYFHVVKDKALKYGDNLRKEQYLFLDPINFKDPDHLAFDNEGMVHPISADRTTISYQRAEYSIRRLNLNFSTLASNRKSFYREAINKVLKIERYLAEEDFNPDHERQVKISELMHELWRMCSRNAEYSAAVKYCLKSTGHDWAIEIINKAA